MLLLTLVCLLSTPPLAQAFCTATCGLHEMGQLFAATRTHAGFHLGSRSPEGLRNSVNEANKNLAAAGCTTVRAKRRVLEQVLAGAAYQDWDVALLKAVASCRSEGMLPLYSHAGFASARKFMEAARAGFP